MSLLFVIAEVPGAKLEMYLSLKVNEKNAQISTRKFKLQRMNLNIFVCSI